MHELQQGLLITAIGMGLVFAVIIFLWGLMALMMRLTSSEKQMAMSLEDEQSDQKTLPLEFELTEAKRRAAAAAAAVEIAILKNRARNVQQDNDKRTAGLSPWQTVHRLRQLDRKKR